MDNVDTSLLPEGGEDKGSAEHIQNMLDVADGKAPSTGEGTEGAPEGTDEDAALKQELLDYLSKQEGGLKAALARMKGETQDQPDTKSEDNPQDAPEDKPDDNKDAPLDFNKFTEEFTKSGSLSEASYKELESKGIPKEVVDAYIAGQQAIAQPALASIHEMVGGPDEYAAMIQWAAASLPKEEKEQFNSIVAGPSDVLRTAAVRALYDQYKGAVGAPENVISGTSVSRGTSGYSSWAEVEKDMGSPRYQSDEAFRREVMRRLSVSNI